MLEQKKTQKNPTLPQNHGHWGASPLGLVQDKWADYPEKQIFGTLDLVKKKMKKNHQGRKGGNHFGCTKEGWGNSTIGHVLVMKLKTGKKQQTVKNKQRGGKTGNNPGPRKTKPRGGRQIGGGNTRGGPSVGGVARIKGGERTQNQKGRTEEGRNQSG